jgi:hypothetical protein
MEAISSSNNEPVNIIRKPIAIEEMVQEIKKQLR